MTSTPRRKAIQQIADRQIQSVEDYLGVAGTDIYGQYVFGDKAQRQYLPKDVYKKLRRTIEGGAPLDVSIADAVAQGMKAWAMSLGASHYTHWFVPMTGSSAEKHDSFLSPTGIDGILAEFTKSALIKGEPDASSFPSGGIRSTFEARGYTAWDPSCPAFVQVEPNGVTLTIPTAFCSYTGEALDHKTPLLRSQEALNKQALRILRKFGNHTAKHIYTTMGAEQEYFLIDRHFYELRPDLINCGRTLFGAPPSKGQELEDHYFGAIRERILAYMMDLDRELWRLGIPVKTRHNEVAPAQFEIAPVFESASIASDHNMITMQVMRRLALQHGLACIMHEKPFAGVNGSGKHNNWSMSTDSGENLLEPGHNPHENAQFLTYLVAIMHAINKHSDLMRVAVADAGNDHRLGANEAPPAIISIFLGEQLEDIIEQLEKGPATASKISGALALGVTALPELPRDATDRNRTSPFAFTGNKFEFRAVGSSAAIYWPQTILNTIVAEALDVIATKIEAIQGDFMDGLQKILQEEIREHKRILFSGNNYSAEWHEEAARRGLPNLPSTVDALPRLDLPENRALFAKYAVLSEKEVLSRAEIAWERYVKVLNIEALTSIEMAKNQILPAAMKYQGQVAQAIAATASVIKTAQKGQTALLEKIVGLTSNFVEAIHTLEDATAKASAAHGEIHHAARAFRDEVLPAMQALRALGDELETLVADEYWPLPKYREMLFQY